MQSYSRTWVPRSTDSDTDSLSTNSSRSWSALSTGTNNTSPSLGYRSISNEPLSPLSSPSSPPSAAGTRQYPFGYAPSYDDGWQVSVTDESPKLYSNLKLSQYSQIHEDQCTHPPESVEEHGNDENGIDQNGELPTQVYPSSAYYNRVSGTSV